MNDIKSFIGKLGDRIQAEQAWIGSLLLQLSTLDDTSKPAFIAKQEEANKSFFAISENDGYAYADFESENEIPDGTVLILQLRGAILYDSEYGVPGLADLRRTITWALNESRIKGVVLLMESGGGSVYRLWEFTDFLMLARKKKPIIAVYDGIGASACLAIGCCATESYAMHRSARIGSIGAAVSFLDFISFLESIGFKYYYVNAKTNPEKNKALQDLRAGDPSALQEELGELHEEFKALVKSNYPDIPETAMTGRVYSAATAVDQKMLTGVATLEQAVSRVFELANLKTK